MFHYCKAWQRRSGAMIGLFLALALLAGCEQAAPPEPIPPRILFYQPNQQDSLDLQENDEQLFVFRCQAGAGAEYEVFLNDSVVACNDSFLFRPWEHGLTWPETDTDSTVCVKMSLRDGETLLSREWRVNVSVLPGVEFIVVPEERDLITYAGLPIAFHMEVLNVDGAVYYRYFLNGNAVQSGPDYFFVPYLLGEYIVRGHAWWEGGNSIQYIWHVEVLAGEDQDPPEDIDDLRIGSGEQAGELVAAFSPPSDGQDGQVLMYELRVFYQLVPIEEWQTTYLVGLVDASPWQEEERFVVQGLEAGRDIYMRVKSYDSCGNASGWSNLGSGLVAGHTVAGRIIDYTTGAGIEGFQVRYGRVNDTTGPDGRFYCPHVETFAENQNYPPGWLWDEDHSGLGDWFDLIDYHAVNDSVELSLGSFGVEPFESEAYPHFLAYFFHVMNVQQWGLRLVRASYPIHTYIANYENEGLAYHSLIRNSIDIWEDDSGLDIFEEVPELEGAELFFRFIPDTTNFAGVYQVLERDPETLMPLRALIHLNGGYDAAHEAGVMRIIVHELGHAIGIWKHSNDTEHVMNTVNTVDRPAPDEVRLVRSLYHMPVGEDLSLIVED